MKRLAVLFTLGVVSIGRADERPNMVWMLADDQNWNGTSVLMHPEVPFSKSEIFQTPNLEKLAAQGMRFSAAYAPASVCSPTRCSLQLGKSPAQTHWAKAASTRSESENCLLVPSRINKNPRVENIPVPENWYAEDFDDSSRSMAKEYTEEEVGPKEPFFQYDFKGAKFIWKDDIKLDNLVLLRTTIQTPPDGKENPDFKNLTADFTAKSSNATGRLTHNRAPKEFDRQLHPCGTPKSPALRLQERAGTSSDTKLPEKSVRSNTPLT